MKIMYMLQNFGRLTKKNVMIVNKKLGMSLIAAVLMAGCTPTTPHSPSVNPVTPIRGASLPTSTDPGENPSERLTAPPTTTGPKPETPGQGNKNPINITPGKNYYKLPTTGKTVAITFDDGPSKYTPQVLKILQQEGITATFFELGESIDKYPQYTKMLYDAGMSIQGHSYHHEDFTRTSNNGIAKTVNKVSQSIKSTTGETPQCTRPPYGAHTKRVDTVLKKNNQGIILWNVDSLDWSRPGPAKIVNNVMTTVRPGSIILFHDGGGDRTQTIASLPIIIKNLKKNGYTFTTIC